MLFSTIQLIPGALSINNFDFNFNWHETLACKTIFFIHLLLFLKIFYTEFLPACVKSYYANVQNHEHKLKIHFYDELCSLHEHWIHTCSNIFSHLHHRWTTCARERKRKSIEASKQKTSNLIACSVKIQLNQHSHAINRKTAKYAATHNNEMPAGNYWIYLDRH